jgi:hypothetical protein
MNEMIKKAILSGLKLDTSAKISCAFECYCIKKRRYLVFLDAKIRRQDILPLLDELKQETNNENFSDFKSLIVVCETDESVTNNDVIFFDNVKKFIVFVAILPNRHGVLTDTHWIYMLGLNYNSITRKIRRIIGNQ